MKLKDKVSRLKGRLQKFFEIMTTKKTVLHFYKTVFLDDRNFDYQL